MLRCIYLDDFVITLYLKQQRFDTKIDYILTNMQDRGMFNKRKSA